MEKNDLMKPVLILISSITLLVTLAAPLLSLAGKLDFETMRLLLLISAIIWLVVTPFWMGSPKDPSSEKQNS